MIPKLTKRELREVDRELDEYKETEMEIHENSVGNTAIVRVTDWDRIDEENRRKIQEYDEQNRPAPDHTEE